MRILIVSASAGAGHTRAGQALEDAFARLDPGATVHHVDILDFTAKAYKKAYAGGFLTMVNHAPALWGALYRASDRVRRRAEERFTRVFDRLEFAAFRTFVRDFAPDAVLATHFLPCQVFAPTRERGEDRFPLHVAITDFDVHAFWVQPTADRFHVGSDEVRAILAGRGIPFERIEVTGIPIARAFSATYDRSAVRGKLGLDDARPVVLVTAGGAGVGAFADAVQAILDCPGVQVIAVAGRNEALRRRLVSLEPPPGTALRVFGFTDEIAELMAASDLAVAKSGGLTTSECLAMGLPMVVREPIPGQEERNADYLAEVGAGVKAHGLESLRFKVKALLADPERLARMRTAGLAAGRPDAAIDIARTVLASC